ncbi:MAG: sce7726 family protein [Deltaproteobacteria bacterium]|nr:sce7726 family protein [Deltaproteobacteria bacterium]
MATASQKSTRILDEHIRSALLSRLHAEHSHDSDVRIIEELGVCQGSSRVDVALVNGSIHGFEIKSASDDLSRLPTQIDLYGRVFDTVTVVVSPCHLRDARAIIPKWWGISIAQESSEELSLRTIRKPKKNPQKDAFYLAQLLWKDEALDVLRQVGQCKGLVSKPREVIWKKISEVLSLKEVSEVVRKQLKTRPHWRAAQ